MFSCKTFVAALAALTAIPAIAAISVTGPSSERYWVFGTSNQILWTFDQGDPNPVSITVTNGQSDSLNGEFSIAEFVQVSSESFTVTNVTLRPAPGYQVNFVNPQNHSEVYGSSSPFEVKPAGTAPYGTVVYTMLSFSVSGTETRTFTIVSTTVTGQTAANTNSQAPASSGAVTTLPAGPATATLTRGNNNNSGAPSVFSAPGIGTAAVALIGAMIGAVVIL